jgi:hypothetical protein
MGFLKLGIHVEVLGSISKDTNFVPNARGRFAHLFFRLGGQYHSPQFDPQGNY